MAKKKQTLPDIKNQDPLEPINIAELGSNSDPCFGIGYDLSTKECKLCGARTEESIQGFGCIRRHGWNQEIHPRLDSERERKKRNYYQNR